MTGVLFIEFPEQHIHLDPFIDSVYISGSCHFRLYFFFHHNFAVPLIHPLFNPAAPHIAIPLYMAHPFPPPSPALAPAPTAPPASQPQQVLSISLSEEEDSSKDTNSSSSSLICTRQWLCLSQCQHGEWVPLIGIHLGDLHSTTVGDVQSV